MRFRIINNFSMKFFGILETRNNITLKNMNNSTCLLILSEHNKGVSVFEFLKFLLLHFEKILVLKLLQFVDNDNDSVFTMINERSNKNTLMELLKFLKTMFGNSELKSILNLQNKNKKSFFDQIRTYENLCIPAVKVRFKPDFTQTYT